MFYKTIVWVDGAECDTINPADRGLAYGDGLFETMRGENGIVPLLDLHLRRLKKGCEVLALNGIETYLAVAFERIKTEMRELSESANCAYVIKLIVTRGHGGRGYIPPPVVTPPTIVLRISTMQPDAAKQDTGVKLQLCHWRLALSPLLAGIKHLNRLEHVMAAQELSGQEDTQGLLTDANGRVIESLHHNIFIVKRDELITPRITMCGVKGVMRALIIERGAVHWINCKRAGAKHR